MRKTLILLVAFSLMGALPALAQYHPNRGYDTLNIGAVFVYERSSGEDFEVRFIGKRGRLYAFEVHSINGNGTTYNRTIYRNSKGQTVLMKRSDGATIKYDPHDCWMAVGECSYVAYDRNGIPGTYRAHGKATKRGFIQNTDYLNGSKYEGFSKVRLKFDGKGRETTRQIQQGGTRTRFDLKKVVLPK